MKTDPWKLIQLLERDNSRLYKEDMLSQYIDDEGLVKGLLYCLDNMITFGVADIPYSDTQGEGITADEFYHLADQLKNRELTGNAARDAILSLSLQSTIDQWNDWYRRILIKDLRCGVSLKTVNNVKKGTIPVFTYMLAHSGDNNPKKITGDCVVEYKYDGVRAIIIVENSNATIYSRNGKQLKNFPHIEEAFSNKMFDDLVFDDITISDQQENFDVGQPGKSAPNLDELDMVSTARTVSEPLSKAIKSREYQAIMAALQNSRNREQAAEVLGISARTLRHKLQRLREQGMAVTRAYAR